MDSELFNSTLPEEVSTVEAASILCVSKDTVLRYKKAGLLEYRDTAPPSSSRPRYAFTLRSVLKLRMSYRTDNPAPKKPNEKQRRKMKKQPKYQHLQLDD